MTSVTVHRDLVLTFREVGDISPKPLEKVEIVELLVRKLKIPPKMIDAIDDSNVNNSNMMKLRVRLVPDCDPEKYMNVNALIVKPGLRLEPGKRVDYEVWVKIYRTSLDDSNAEILKVLESFGYPTSRMENITYGESTNELMNSVSHVKEPNRKIKMKLSKSIPNFIMMGNKKLFVRHSGQIRYCARCFYTRENCPGKGEAKRCEKMDVDDEGKQALNFKRRLQDVWEEVRDNAPLLNVSHALQCDYLEISGFMDETRDEIWRWMEKTSEATFPAFSLKKTNLVGVWRIPTTRTDTDNMELAAILIRECNARKFKSRYINVLPYEGDIDHDEDEKDDTFEDAGDGGGGGDHGQEGQGQNGQRPNGDEGDGGKKDGKKEEKDSEKPKKKEGEEEDEVLEKEGEEQNKESEKEKNKKVKKGITSDLSTASKACSVSTATWLFPKPQRTPRRASCTGSGSPLLPPPSRSRPSLSSKELYSKVVSNAASLDTSSSSSSSDDSLTIVEEIQSQAPQSCTGAPLDVIEEAPEEVEVLSAANKFVSEAQKFIANASKIVNETILEEEDEGFLYSRSPPDGSDQEPGIMDDLVSRQKKEGMNSTTISAEQKLKNKRMIASFYNKNSPMVARLRSAVSKKTNQSKIHDVSMMSPKRKLEKSPSPTTSKGKTPTRIMKKARKNKYMKELKLSPKESSPDAKKSFVNSNLCDFNDSDDFVPDAPNDLHERAKAERSRKSKAKRAP